jgi:hypothetical protein
MANDPDPIAQMIREQRRIDARDLDVPIARRGWGRRARHERISEPAPDIGAFLAGLLGAPPPAPPADLPREHRSNAPIKRAWLDASVPFWRVLISVAFIGYSIVSTVLGVRDDLTPIQVLLDVLITVPIPLIGGIVVALLLQLAQLLLAERHKPGYVLSLIADAYYTRRQTLPWATVVIGTAFVSEPTTTEALLWAFVVSFGLWLILSELAHLAVNTWWLLGLALVVAVLYALTIGTWPTDSWWRLGSRWLVLQSSVWLSAIAVAYFGEVLLFGARRR